MSADVGCAARDDVVVVLLIEDDDADARLVREALRDATGTRFCLRRAERLLDGLEIARDVEPDVVLLDLTLPDSEGLATLVAAARSLIDLPIVVLTGLDDEEIARRAVDEGAQDYLRKTDLAPAALARALRYALGRHAASAALRESEHRFRQVFEHAPVGMAVCGLAGLEQGRVLRVNRAFRAMVQRGDDELVGRALVDLIHPDDAALVARALDHARPTTPSQLRLRLVTSEGTTRVAAGSVAVTDLGPAQGRVVVQLADITDQELAEQQLRWMALHDPLTGLANRTLFTDRLCQALAIARRDGGKVGVLFLDLDRFKGINDALGHAVGDRLLIHVAERLRQALRPGDSVARIGGDEFLVLCPGVADEQVLATVAHRLRDAVADALVLGDQTLVAEASAGASISDGRDTAEAVIGRADAAMYRAKRNGNGVALYEDASDRTALLRPALEVALRQAIEGGELRLATQPLRDLTSGEIVGREALVRWEHPERGLLLPAQFLHVAEESDLIVPLGEWVLENACKLAVAGALDGSADGVARGDESLWINLSGRQAAIAGLAERVLDVLAVCGWPPERLRLELTESVLIASSAQARHELATLRRAGVGIGLDDFGTGYASMTYLTRLPVSFLKIDGAFVREAPTTPESASIVRAVVSLGRELSLQVVAEGIESAEQLRWVRQAGCEVAQGFYLGTPTIAPRS